jgi:hypothetical protein
VLYTHGVCFREDAVGRGGGVISATARYDLRRGLMRSKSKLSELTAELSFEEISTKRVTASL